MKAILIEDAISPAKSERNKPYFYAKKGDVVEIKHDRGSMYVVETSSGNQFHILKNKVEIINLDNNK
jgi:hypothetical protein